MKIIATLSMLVLVTSANADCRARVFHHNVVQAVAVQYPYYPYLYAVSYGDQEGTAIKLLVQEVEKRTILELQLKQLQGGAQVAPNQAVTPKQQGNALAILQARCASCHDAQAPKGGFTLFSNGAMVKLSCEELTRVTRSIRTNAMPKAGPKLTDEEFAVVAEFIEGLILKK